MIESRLHDIPSDADIADAARLAMRNHSGTIYLSRLGQDLRQVFGASFKAALGTRSLGDFVNEHLCDSYEVWGRGPFKRVGILGSASNDDAPPSRRKYLGSVWKAFSTPIQEGYRRWITIGPPLSVRETQAAAEVDSFEVSLDFIIAGGSQHPRERSEAIGAAIQRWAELAGIPLSSLEEAQPETISPRTHRAESASGIDALRRLIAVVPEEERSRYSLPMNLVGRLLQVP